MNGMAILGGLVVTFLVLKASLDIPVHLGLLFVDSPNGKGGLTGAQVSLGDILFLMTAIGASLYAVIQLFVWGRTPNEVAENIPAISVVPGVLCCAGIGLTTCYFTHLFQIPIMFAVLIGAVFGVLILLWMKDNFVRKHTAVEV